MKKTAKKAQPVANKPAHRHQMGHFVPRRTKTEICLCTCGVKYLKTRKNQSVCVWCIYTMGKVATS